jgi:hypothetical protein
VLNFHKVWFVFGAAEFELPACARSWWNIGHQSTVDCAPENLGTPLDSAVPEEMLFEKAKIKNSTTKAKQTIAFLLIFFLLCDTLALKVRLIANQDEDKP